MPPRKRRALVQTSRKVYLQGAKLGLAGGQGAHSGRRALAPPSSHLPRPTGAPRDPAVDTFADPAIWKSFAFFYKESLSAAKYAYNASRAENEAEFKKSAVDLRLTCDTCHAAYQKNN